ncbi:hypothetical protein LCGC14_3070720 [marine sediment metagenome]|uniref:Uncharacterized protein n=1 Tax=marine sediment metagenome TaxID=412755 RepID=A0A0F8X4I4_9ZZZZ
MINMIERVALTIGHLLDCPVLNVPDEPPYVEPGPCNCGSEIRARAVLEVSHHNELVEILKIALEPFSEATRNPDGSPVGEPVWCATARLVLEKVGALP